MKLKTRKCSKNSKEGILLKKTRSLYVFYFSVFYFQKNSRESYCYTSTDKLIVFVTASVLFFTSPFSSSLVSRLKKPKLA